MASAVGGLFAASPSPPAFSAKVPVPNGRRSAGFPLRRRGGVCRAMVQQEAFQGATATYAKEMERLSAKESILLAFKDSGGFASLVSGKTTEMQRIDVNERIVGLERLNPTPRPTTSPFLEGQWTFAWFGTGNPGLFAAMLLAERSLATVANLLGLNMLIKDGYSKVTANLKFLNSIESKILITTKLSVEGPSRMKEEYVEGVFETPTISDEAIPVQLKGALGQAAGALQQLPAPIRDAFDNGLKIPLSGTFQRLFMVSYLDEEILIIRDASGAPDVLTRLDGPLETDGADPIPEYES